MITTMTMILGQINTEPMVSQIGMLSVVEAPDILYNQVKRWFFRFICFFFSFPSIVAPDILYNQVKRYFFSYVVFLFRVFSFHSIGATWYSLQPAEEIFFLCCCFPFFNFLILFNRRHSIFFTTRRRDDILQSSYFLSPTDQLILFMNDVLSNSTSDLSQMLS